MDKLVYVLGTDHEALYINGEHICEAYLDELWNRGYVLDVVDEYNIDTVEKVFSPGTTNFPDTLEELEESDEYNYEEESIQKRDSIAN